MADIINQTNYEDQQNSEIDIEQAYQYYIKVIDAIRSRANISGNLALLDHFDLDSWQTISSKVKTESIPQESRCHAFYRWIGFPVVSSNQKDFYNPGHDRIKDKNRKLNDSSKLGIANNIDAKFKQLSLQREMYSSNMMTIFSNSYSINAATLSLLSGATIRKFNDHVGGINPFDFDIKAQNYIIPLDSQVGIKNDISLLKYVDANGTEPSDLTVKLLKNQSHFMKPFFVDPRIDFSVFPAKNRIAVPFVPDSTYLKMGEDVLLRPLLEKIIRERFSLTNNSEKIGTSQENITDYLNNVDAIKDEQLIQKVKNTGGDLTLTDKASFLYYFKLAQAMMKKLVVAQNTIKEAQGKYYWLPIPSSTGPEGGCKSHDTIVSTTLYKEHKELITDLDREITKAYIRVSLNSFSKKGNESIGKPEALNFGLPTDIDNVFGPDVAPPEVIGDLSQKNFDDLIDARNKSLDSACDALKTIEIVMGEYTGLGLCDIIAVIASLYIMPKGDLLGFLDVDALTRAQATLGYTKEELAIIAGHFEDNIQKSTESFIDTVNDFYNLMVKLYEDQANTVGS